jgi:hypothetical protein
VNVYFFIIIIITNADAVAITVAVTATFVATTGRYVRPQRAPLTQLEQDREDVGTEKLTKLSKTILYFDSIK